MPIHNNIPTDPYRVTTTDIKSNMPHIHAPIVSRHLATRGNNTILRTPKLHVSSSEEILHRLTRGTLAQLITNISHLLKSYVHKVDVKSHPSPLGPPFVALTHTTHIISSTVPDKHYVVWICGQTHQSDGTAGLMDPPPH